MIPFKLHMRTFSGRLQRHLGGIKALVRAREFGIGGLCVGCTRQLGALPSCQGFQRWGEESLNLYGMSRVMTASRFTFDLDVWRFRLAKPLGRMSTSLSATVWRWWALCAARGSEQLLFADTAHSMRQR